MEKREVEVPIKDINNFEVRINFNDYTYVIDKTDISSLASRDNEEDMLEIFPGIFICKKNFFKFILKSIIIHICNFRDKIKVSLVTNQTNETLYSSSGSRIIREKPCSESELNTHKLSLASIHFPEHETGGGGNRCCLKSVLYELKIYPELHSLNYKIKDNFDPYFLFNFEEIFRLPSYIPVLGNRCWEFCSKRNKENDQYNVIGGVGNSVDQLINKHYSGAVKLIVNDDNTLSVINGNHRICFLKHFESRLSLNKIWFSSINSNESKIRNQKSKKRLDTISYYEQLKIMGVSKKEAREILLNGLDSVELFKYLLDNNYIKL